MKMNIVYASETQHDQSIRHISYSRLETLCGKYSGPVVTLALPVNCDECRTKNGKLNRNPELRNRHLGGGE